MAALLEGSHLILCTDDDMVDSNALMHAVKHANGSGAAVQLHLVDSSHNAERDDPDLILDSMCKIMKPLVTGSYEPARQTAVAG